MPILGRTGQLFVISAPSGVGKTTLVRLLLCELPELRFSVSCTTRPPRLGETDGKDYHFMNREAFLTGITAGRFLEWAQVHGEYYGTDRLKLEAWLEAGKTSSSTSMFRERARFAAFSRWRTTFLSCRPPGRCWSRDCRRGARNLLSRLPHA